LTARGTGRGRRLGLTRDKVIAKAVTMIDRDGPDAFSLRKLATELDIENMSLYSHVPNRDALLDGVAEALLSEIDFSGAGNGTWQERVRAHCVIFRAAAKRHRKAFPLMLTRPTKSPAALEAIRSALGSFADLDLSPKERVHVLRSYNAYLIGTIMRELGYTVSLSPSTMDPARCRERTAEIAADGDALLRAVAPYLAVSDHDAEFGYGLEMLIAGLAARLGVPYDGGPSQTDPHHGCGGTRA
jgi:AcrR family transcriptional regulator